MALSNERTAIEIARRRLDASVLLVKALGGLWDSPKIAANSNSQGAAGGS
jgi:outer membrane protein TolC